MSSIYAIKEYPYELDESGRLIVPDFSAYKEDDIVSYVVEWFRTHFCDPNEETPIWDGEFQFIWGGPYETENEIIDAFGDDLTENQIKKIVEELERDGIQEWAPSNWHKDQLDRADEYEAEQYEEWLRSNEPRAVFTRSKDEVIAFNKDHSGPDEAFVNRMVFVQAWAVVEGYLSSQLIKQVMQTPLALKRLYELDRDLKKRKFDGKAVLADSEVAAKEAISYLESVSYHATGKVISIYKTCFEIPKDLVLSTDGHADTLIKLVKKRHDCVHRNGRTKDDQEVTVSEEEILSVLSAGDMLAQELAKLFPPQLN